MQDSNSTASFSADNPFPARRGSVSERFVKCGKSGCACAHDSKARHGPYFSFTHAVKGRTKSRFLSAEEATVVRRQIERGKELRDEVDIVWKRCEEAADRELKDLRAASQENAEKKGSEPRFKRSSEPPPSKKSKRS